ncbi:MAG: 4Fe-4S binding protein [Chloroflexi bacterium]|nr:4Fe-4S binding protein [Chloroflexota bacterium]
MSRVRWATQILALILLNLGFIEVAKTGVVAPFFYCYGCPLATTACPIGALQSFAAVGTFPSYTVGAVGLFGLAAGRFWCGWGCPFGTIQDFLAWARRRDDFLTLRNSGWMRLLVLVGLIVAAWIAADTLFCKVCPAGSLFGAVPHRFYSPALSFGTFFWVHIGTLVLAVVAFLLVGRFWCRFLCPLGGIFGLFNRVSILKIKLDMSKCNECRKCLGVCPTKIEKVEDIGESGDCTCCGKCIEACPGGAIKITASARD